MSFILSACGGGGGNTVPTVAGVSPSGSSTSAPVATVQPTPGLLLAGAPQVGKIKHIVFILQENRTFDGIFGGPNPFPGVDAVGSGRRSDGTVVQLKAQLLGQGADLNNDYKNWLAACDPDPSKQVMPGQPMPCRMDGFDKNSASSTDAYNYAPYSQSKPYWDIAAKYALSDHFFASHNSESYTAHQYLFAGQSGGTLDAPLPASIGPLALTDWNCSFGNKSQRTYLWLPNVSTVGAVPSGSTIGPRPCWNYTSMADLLNRANLGWRLYSPFVTYNIDALVSYNSIFNNSKYLPSCGIFCTRYEDNAYFRTSLGTSTFFLDYGPKATLAPVTWFLPPLFQSDHVLPTGTQWSASGSGGPQWVASVVNAIGANKNDWNSTVIFITWDDWGGNYDHVPPYVVRDAAGVGFRVPLMVVSPYTKPGCVLNATNAEFGTLLKFTEDTFGLGKLDSGSVDQSPYIGNLDQCFDWSTQRAFQSVVGGQSAQYFLKQQDPYPNANIDDGAGT